MAGSLLSKQQLQREAEFVKTYLASFSSPRHPSALSQAQCCLCDPRRGSKGGREGVREKDREGGRMSGKERKKQGETEREKGEKPGEKI